MIAIATKSPVKTKQKSQQKQDDKIPLILLGNGQHKAIFEVKGKLVKQDNQYRIILSDGSEFNAIIRHKILSKKLEDNQDGIVYDGFLFGYPKCNRKGELYRLDLIKLNNEPIIIKNKGQNERFLLIGVWCEGNVIIVQRDFKMMTKYFQDKGKLPTYFYHVDTSQIKNKLVVGSLYEFELIRLENKFTIKNAKKL